MCLYPCPGFSPPSFLSLSLFSLALSSRFLLYPWLAILNPNSSLLGVAGTAYYLPSPRYMGLPSILPQVIMGDSSTDKVLRVWCGVALSILKPWTIGVYSTYFFLFY